MVMVHFDVSKVLVYVAFFLRELAVIETVPKCPFIVTVLRSPLFIPITDVETLVMLENVTIVDNTNEFAGIDE